jgi:hypothetical protein
MTGFNNKNNIKFVPVALKTYEVRYVENREQNLIAKFATDFLGLNQIECSGSSSDAQKQIETAKATGEEVAKSVAASAFPVAPTATALNSTEKKADDFADRVERSGGEVEHRVERTGDASAYYRKSEK